MRKAKSRGLSSTNKKALTAIKVRFAGSKDPRRERVPIGTYKPHTTRKRSTRTRAKRSSRRMNP